MVSSRRMRVPGGIDRCGTGWRGRGRTSEPLKGCWKQHEAGGAKQKMTAAMKLVAAQQQ
jgi:hypothetical protein